MHVGIDRRSVGMHGRRVAEIDCAARAIAGPLNIGSRPSLVRMVAPAAARSVHGENSRQPAGSGSPASRKATSVASARPPPAESPRSRSTPAACRSRPIDGRPRLHRRAPLESDARAQDGSRGKRSVRSLAWRGRIRASDAYAANRSSSRRHGNTARSGRFPEVDTPSARSIHSPCSGRSLGPYDSRRRQPPGTRGDQARLAVSARAFSTLIVGLRVCGRNCLRRYQHASALCQLIGTRSFDSVPTWYVRSPPRRWTTASNPEKAPAPPGKVFFVFLFLVRRQNLPANLSRRILLGMDVEVPLPRHQVRHLLFGKRRRSFDRARERVSCRSAPGPWRSARPALDRGSARRLPDRSALHR